MVLVGERMWVCGSGGVCGVCVCVCVCVCVVCVRVCGVCALICVGLRAVNRLSRYLSKDFLINASLSGALRKARS